MGLILITRGFGPGKTNPLLNQIKKVDDNYSVVDITYFHIKDLNEAKYQHLIIKCGNIGLKILKDRKTLIKYSNKMQDVYENIE